MKRLLLLLTLAIPSFLFAKVVYVNANYTGTVQNGESWSTPYTGLKAAVDSADAGDELWFAEGEYNNIPSQSFGPVNLEKSLSFYGGFNGSEQNRFERDYNSNRTIFSSYDQNGEYNLFSYKYDAVDIKLVFDGVTFQNTSNIYISFQNKYEFQLLNCTVKGIGGFRTENNSTPTNSKLIIDNLIYENNTSPFGVNGIEEVFVQNSRFIGNTGNSVFECVGGQKTTQLTNVEFLKNTTSSNIFLSNGETNLTLNDVRLIENVCEGGGIDMVNGNNIYIENLNCKENSFKNNLINANSYSGNFSITNSLFQNDTSSASSNLIFIYPNAGSANVVLDNEFLNNKSKNIIQYVGTDNASLTLENNVYKDNNVESYIIDTYFEKLVFDGESYVDNIANKLINTYSFGSSKIEFSNAYVAKNKVTSSNINGTNFIQLSANEVTVNSSIIDSNHVVAGNLLQLTNNYKISNSTITNNNIQNGHLIYNGGSGGEINGSYITNNLLETVNGIPDAYNYSPYYGIIRGTNVVINNSFFIKNVYRQFNKSTQTHYFNIQAAKFNNTVVAENKLLSDQSGSFFYLSNGEVFNATIYGNSFEEEDFYWGSGSRIINSIFWKNRAANIINGGTNPVINYSNIQSPYTGQGNLSLNPQFVDPENGDFRLSCTSPLLNKGNNAYAPKGTDINGVPRIMGDTVDMGAYEFNGDPNVSNATPVLDFALSNENPCKTELVQFTNETLNPDHYTFSWNLGDGSPLLNKESIEHKYTQSGEYSIKLMATNACGRVFSMSKNINVKDAAIPSIKYKTTVCAGDVVEFTTDATCGDLLWSVEGGTIQEGQNTSTIKVAFGSGNYSNAKVRLLATGCGNDALCELPIEIEIPIIPQTVSIAGSDTVCENGLYEYRLENGKKIADAFYQWTALGGTIQGKSKGYDLDTIQVIWNNNTEHRILVTLSHSLLPCTVSDSTEITILPQFAFTNTMPSAVCGFTITDLQTTPSGSFIWSVNGTNNQIDQSNNQLVWGNSPGAYIVKAEPTTNDVFCNNLDSTVIQVNLSPIIDAVLGDTLVDTISVYSYQASHFNEGGSLIWTVTGGTKRFSHGNSIDVAWDKEEPFLLSVNYSKGNCVSNTLPLEIEKDLIFTIAGVDTICVNSEAQYSINNLGFSNLTYTWFSEGSEISSGETASVRFANSGFQTLEAEIVKEGKIYRARKNVYVEALNASLSVEGQEYISPEGGGQYTYRINNPEDLSLDINVIGGEQVSIQDTVVEVIWEAEGPFNIQVSATEVGGQCPSEIVTFEVKKARELEKYIDLIEGSTCLNQTTTFSIDIDELATEVNWSLDGGGTIIRESNSEIEIEWSSTPGDYKLTVSFLRYGFKTYDYPINIEPLPNPEILGNTVCGNRSSILTTAASYAEYQWYIEGEPEDILSDTTFLQVKESGYYVAEVTDVFGCKGSSSLYIEAVTLPKLDVFLNDPSKICVSDSARLDTLKAQRYNNYTYEWTKNGSPIQAIDGVRVPVNIATENAFNDTYTVTAYYSPECYVSASRTVNVLSEEACNQSSGGGTPCGARVSFEFSGCQPYTFTNTSEQSGGFSWSFNDGTSSRQVNPGPKYFKEAGYYEVTLSNGCARSVKVVEVPFSANFETQKIICENTETTFRDLSGNLPDSPIEERIWEFGDGTTISVNNGENILHTYGDTGRFVVKLTVIGKNSKGESCQNTKTLEIHVRDQPSGYFIIDEPECNDNLYTFKYQREENAGELEFQWDLDGKVSTTENPSFRYENFGSKDISLTVTNLIGCSINTTDNIFINPPVEPKDIVTVKDELMCYGDSVQLIAPNSNSGYKWYLNGHALEGNASEGNFFYAKTGGDYSVRYTESSCLVFSNVKTVDFFEPQLPITQSAVPCLGSSVELTLENATNNYRVEWYKEDQFLKSGKTYDFAKLTQENEGNYTALLLDKNSDCTYPLEYTLVINEVPAKPEITGSQRICYSDSLFVLPVNNDTTYIYTWFNGNTELSTKDTLNINNAQSDYSLKLTATNKAGCSASSFEYPVIVDDQKTLTLNELNLVCENTTQTITSNFNEEQFDFTWYRADTIFSLENKIEFSSIKVTDESLYRATAISNNNSEVPGCSFVSEEVSVTVKPGPAKPLIEGGSEFCEGESLTLTTPLTENIIWSNFDTTSSVEVFKSGSYGLTVVDPVTGCQAKSNVNIVRNPLPNFGFIGTGSYESCRSEEVAFEALEDYPYYQWKRDGVAIGGNNEVLFASKTGKYTVEIKTDKGCVGESDTLRIKSLPCACVVTTTVDDIGVGSLRDAIYCANNKAGIDNISFELEGEAPFILAIDSALPIISEGFILDGFSQAGEGNRVIEIEPGAYNEKLLDFSASVKNTEISGIKFSGFTTAISFGSNSENTLIEDNIFDDNLVALIFGNGGKSNRIVKNTFTNSLFAINAQKNENTIIEENTFSSSDIAIRGQGLKGNTIRKNTFDNLNQAGVVFLNTCEENVISENYFYSISGNAVEVMSSSLNNELRQNYFGYNNQYEAQPISGNAIKISQSDSSLIRSNYFANTETDAVSIQEGQTSSLQFNQFGLMHNGDSGSIKGNAINVDSSASIASNTFINTDLDAVYVDLEKVVLSRNIFNNPDKSVKAIDLHQTANSNLQPAKFTAYENTFDDITLHGASDFSNEKVEVFYNDNAPQTALVYLGTATSDANKEWSFVVPKGDYYDVYGKNYYVNTATRNNETSELSGAFQTGCFNCVCTVENTNDSGEKSLRAAVDSAHNGVCNIIEFDLQRNSIIELDSAIRPITVSVKIQGPEEARGPITIAGQQTAHAFQLESFGAVISNLTFEKWDTSVVIIQDNNSIEKIKINNSGLPIFISGDNNTISEVCINCAGNSSSITGIRIEGSNNRALNNKINSAKTSVEINGGTQNKVLNTTLKATEKAILHANNGNLNYSAPQNLSASINTTTNIASISGEAVIGDKIQVFLSDFTGKVASQFITEIIATEATWSVTLPEEYVDATENNFFVATATSAQGNTSELSDVVKLGDNTVICVVNTTDNGGEGSLRAAIECVNDAGLSSLSAKVLFDLPEYKQNVIEVLDSGFTIVNSFGVIVDPNEVDVQVSTGTSQLPYAFRWNSDNVYMAGLSFNGFRKGIEIKEGIDNQILGNNFINVDSSLVIKNNARVTIKTNIISNTEVGISIQQSYSNIDGNTIESGNKGIVLEEANGTFINDNTIENQVLLSSIEVNNSNYIQALGNKIYSDNSKDVSFKVFNSDSIALRNNQLIGGKVGLQINASGYVLVETNEIDSTSVKAIELKSSEFIYIKENTSKGLTDGSKAIDLNYTNSDKSNKSFSPPVFTEATYKKRQLILRGRATAESDVELFITSDNKIDLKEYLKTTVTDQFGIFEFKINMPDPTKINDDTYRATQSFSKLYFENEDYTYTSEASLAFNPNIKICYVTKESDDDIEGTMRYNIGLANKDECNLMLFDVAGVSEVNITPQSYLPTITAERLTIDATSQNGYSDNPVVNINEANNLTYAFKADYITGNLAIHGIRVKNFKYSFSFDNAEFFESSLSELNDFETGSVEFATTVNSKRLIFDENRFTSPNSDYLLRSTTPNVLVKNSSFGSALKTPIRLESDSAIVFNNVIKAEKMDSVFAIESYDTDSTYIGENKIENFIQGFYSERDTNLLFMRNEFLLGENEYLTKAILVNKGYKSSVFNNNIPKSDSAIVLHNSFGMFCSGNEIDSTLYTGIYVNHSDSTTIEGNVIWGAIIGILIDTTHATLVKSNLVAAHDSVGVLIAKGSDSTKVERNTVGVHFVGDAYKSKGAGIVLNSSYNIIGGSDTARNKITNNIKGGVLVIEGTHNKITHNEIFRNDTTFHKPIHFAIEHIDNGNDLKEKPAITGYKEMVQGQVFQISGESEPNDSVHLYRADGYYQDARYYIGSGITGSDNKWSITVDTADFYKKLNYTTLSVVATATDDENNTSELSDLAYIGTCYITSTLDSADNVYPTPNSFRQAVVCANSLPVRDSILVALDGGEGYDVFLQDEMLMLDNPNGIYFSGKNLTTAKGHTFGSDTLGVQSSYWTGAVDTTTFWRISRNSNNSEFNHLRVQYFDTALHIMPDSNISINQLSFTGINNNAVLIEGNSQKVILDSLIIKNSVGGALVTIKNGASDIHLSNSKVSSTPFGLKADGITKLRISNNVFKFAELPLEIINSDSVYVDSNTFVKGASVGDSLLKNGPLLKNVNVTSIQKNKFEKVDIGSSFTLSNTKNFTIAENSFEEEADTGFVIKSSSAGKVAENTFGKRVYKAPFYVENSDSILFFKNHIANMDSSGFDIVKSTRIKMSENIILATDEDSTDFDHPLINIYQDKTIVSNSNKNRPTIDGYFVDLVGDCSSDEKVSIYLYGTADPKDDVEIFISDSTITTFTEHVITDTASAKGYWETKIPKEYYERDPKFIYSFIVTATDSSWNTSRESTPFRFNGVRNDVIVKNVADTGIFTLRSAVDEINCSDVHSFVIFNIEDEAPYTIVLKDSLPVIETWRGATFDARRTQGVYLRDSLEALEIDSTVTVDASDFGKRPLFIIEEDWVEFDRLNVVNTKNAFLFRNTDNILNDVIISNPATASRGDTAVYCLGGGNKIINSEIRDYYRSIEIPEKSNGNRIEKNLFEDVDVAVSVQGNTEKNTIIENRFQADSLNVWVKGAKSSNFILSNTFGANDKPIEVIGVSVENSNNQYIDANHFPAGNDKGNTNVAFITIGDSSHYNSITNNRFGMDSLAVVHYRSDMVGILLASSDEDNPLISNVVSANDFSGLKKPAIAAYNIDGSLITGNFIGIDSAKIQKGLDNEYYDLAEGIDTSGIVLYSAARTVLSSNQIINYTGYGIDVKQSEYINLSMNLFLSERTNNKGIQLNLGTLDSSNFGMKAPVIDTNNILSKTRITVEGSSAYPFSTIQLYEAYGATSDDKERDQTLRYIRDVETDANGKWVAELRSDNFGFSKYNKYVAQVTVDENSSELSSMYTVQSLLCRLKKQGINLLDSLYNPCPESNFEIDAQLEGLTYSWVTSKGDTLSKSRLATIDEDAIVTLKLEDNFNCVHEEELTVVYKDRPEEPRFLVSSNTFVSDTILIIDVTESVVEDYDWSSTTGLYVIPSDSLPNTIEGPDGIMYPIGRFVEVIAPDTGYYTVTQRSKREGCYISVEKGFDVTYKDPSAENPYSLTRGINSLDVYPSPVASGETANVLIKTRSKDPIEISLYTNMGQLLFQEQLEGKTRYNYAISTTGFTSSIYIVKVATGSEILTFKFSVVGTE